MNVAPSARPRREPFLGDEASFHALDHEVRLGCGHVVSWPRDPETQAEIGRFEDCFCPACGTPCSIQAGREVA